MMCENGSEGITAAKNIKDLLGDKTIGESLSDAIKPVVEKAIVSIASYYEKESDNDT